VLGILAILLKPPTVALPVIVGLYSRVPRALVGAALGLVIAIAVIAVSAATGHSPGSLEGWIRAARATYPTTPPLLLVLFQLALAAVALIRLATVRDAILGHPELTFAAAAGFSVVLGTLVHLNPQSMILLALPLCFVLKAVLATPQPMSRLSLVAFGACCGLLSGDALLPNTAGWMHAVPPWGILGLFLAGAGLLRPELMPAALACWGTNMLVTFLPWSGAALTEFAAIAAFVLLILLGTPAAAAPSVATSK
jgi:hypothetical protein